MTLQEALTNSLRSVLFDADRGQAEEVEYQRGSELPQSIPIIFQAVNENDQLENNVYGDSCFVMIHEDDLHEFFERKPLQEDKITRSLPLALAQIERTEVWYLVGEAQRNSVGVWKCLAQKNIRLYP